MKAKPTLGFPTRTDAVTALRADGLSTVEIADMLDMTTANVSALEHSAARTKKRQARPAEEMGRTVLFPKDVLDALERHAARRGMHVNRLVRRIVETVADDDLVDSVLDDLDEIDGGEA